MELAASEALAETGEVPAEAARALRQHAAFDVARIHEIEREVKHDVIAFTTAVAEKMAAAGQADASRWLHYGLTSNDVVDTAQALVLQQASAVLEKDSESLLESLQRRAFEFKHTVQIGRTHGMHAEPITFGLKLALWYDEMKRDLARLNAAAEDLRVGKISGAVGTFGHIGPEAEEKICARLGLEARRHRLASDRARPPCRLDLGACHLNRHARKNCARNPPSAAHRSARSGGAVQCRAKRFLGHAAQAQPGHLRADLRPRARGARQLNPAIEDIALWHERDISHSSVERVILADSAILTDYLLAKTIWLIDGMRVYPERMRQNLESTHGLIFPDSCCWIWPRPGCFGSRLTA